MKRGISIRAHAQASTVGRFGLPSTRPECAKRPSLWLRPLLLLPPLRSTARSPEHRGGPPGLVGSAGSYGEATTKAGCDERTPHKAQRQRRIRGGAGSGVGAAAPY